MASRVTLVCDMDDGHAEAENTFRFSIVNQKYKIDLCYDHTAELMDTFERWVDAAQADNHADEKKPHPNGKPPRRSDLTAIREWARSQGEHISDRGRIPVDVLNRYDHAHR